MDRSPTQLAEEVRGSWHHFVDVFEPLRPDLYRYTRYLTRSAWEAEDLVQDTLARAFVTLGCTSQPPANPKAWLFRVASNVWIDRIRRTREAPGEIPDVAGELEPDGIDRDAAAHLIGRLAPQERAAVVLKDVFDFTLAEIAESLSTSVGAVKPRSTVVAASFATSTLRPSACRPTPPSTPSSTRSTTGTSTGSPNCCSTPHPPSSSASPSSTARRRWAIPTPGRSPGSSHRSTKTSVVASSPSTSTATCRGRHGSSCVPCVANQWSCSGTSTVTARRCATWRRSQRRTDVSVTSATTSSLPTCSPRCAGTRRAVPYERLPLLAANRRTAMEAHAGRSCDYFPLADARRRVRVPVRHVGLRSRVQDLGPGRQSGRGGRRRRPNRADTSLVTASDARSLVAVSATKQRWEHRRLRPNGLNVSSVRHVEDERSLPRNAVGPVLNYRLKECAQCGEVCDRVALGVTVTKTDRR